MTRRTKHCTFPGCTARLDTNSASYATDTCVKHRHAEGLCQCATCVGQRRRVGDGRAVRVAEVREASQCSTITRVLLVSLPREPWNE